MSSENDIVERINNFLENNKISEFKEIIIELLSLADKYPSKIENHIYLSMCYLILNENNLAIKWLNVAKKINSNDDNLKNWNVFLNENMNKLYFDSDYFFEKDDSEKLKPKKVLVNKIRRLK